MASPSGEPERFTHEAGQTATQTFGKHELKGEDELRRELSGQHDALGGLLYTKNLHRARIVKPSPGMH